MEKLQTERDKFITDLTKAIGGQFLPALRKPLTGDDGANIMQMQNQMLKRQQHVNAMLNSYSHDLAYRRQIIPQTRGAVKKVVYGN